MSNHTPGPWIWARDILENNAQDYLCSEDYKTRILQAQWRGEPADARLIAAAPDLLEACELHISALRSQIRDGKQRPEYAELIYQAQKKMMAAIAKARGEA